MAALGAALALAVGCAGPPPAAGDAAEDRIVETATGRFVARGELADRLRASDFVLLGEQHDNPHHHVRRGELLAALGAGAVVVAEQLPRGARLQLAAGADDAALLAALQPAGFEPRGWRWPLHAPLFAGMARGGALLFGGNAARDIARQVAREGESAQPAVLRDALSPLAEPARAQLDAALVEGHCGQLAGARLNGMRAAQRTRDAAMWLTLREAAQAGARPAVLVAGNGHVRRDYGVAQLIAAQQPASRVVVVGFGEPGARVEAQAYDYVWITAAAARPDPCAAFSMPPAAAASAPR